MNLRKKRVNLRKYTFFLLGSICMFEFAMTEIFLKEESYKLMGLCMKVHAELGPGFKEVVYKDALELELQMNNIPYVREQPYETNYRGLPLGRKFKADFVVYGCILLEVKAVSMIIKRFITDTINYLKASSLKLGIIANFGEKSFTFKRVLL